MLAWKIRGSYSRSRVPCSLYSSRAFPPGYAAPLFHGPRRFSALASDTLCQCHTGEARSDDCPVSPYASSQRFEGEKKPFRNK